MLELAAFLGAHQGRSYLQGWGYGEAAQRYAFKQAGARGGLNRMAVPRMKSLVASYGRQMESDVWKAFTRGGGGPIRRWRQARTAARGTMAKLGLPQAGKMAATRAAATALGSSVLGIGLNYMIWGTLPPMLTDMAIGGFNTLADVGRRMREQGPSTGVRFVDTRQAATMRQAGLQAIHESGLGGYRNMLSTEASMFHR